MSRATTSGPVSDSRVLTGSFGERRADLGHRPGEVDLHDLVGEVLAGDLRQVLRGVAFELLDEHAVRGDLGLGLAVGRAGHGDADGAGRAVAGEPDDADVVAEVLAAELRADAELAGHVEDLLLEVDVAEGVAGRGALGAGGCRGSGRRRAWRP